MKNLFKKNTIIFLGLILALLLTGVTQYRTNTRVASPNPKPRTLTTVADFPSIFQVSDKTKSVLPESSPIPKNAVVLQTLERDLYGDNHIQNIVLYMQKDDGGFPVSLHLMVNGVEKVSTKLAEGYTLGTLGFENLDNDQTDEVLVYQNCTGSSGAALLDIYEPSGNRWQHIFSAPNTDENHIDMIYSVKYIGDYQVRFIDKQTGLTGTITLDEKNYRGWEADLTKITTWVDPISHYIFKDLDSDQYQEVIAVQGVFGLCHPDLIAELLTTFKKVNGTYQPIIQTLTAPCDRTGQGKPLAEVHY
ncbi:MAG TPA: hypothetical protein VN426_16400 [Syntrophomonadaceae bacterium]|nr:hypothetical protein [Syntrophomonadaceae bacterium]